MNELPIGTIIELPFIKIKVMEDKDQEQTSCFECVFWDDCPYYAKKWFGECSALNRKDNKYVHFEEVKEEE